MRQPSRRAAHTAALVQGPRINTADSLSLICRAIPLFFPLVFPCAQSAFTQNFPPCLKLTVLPVFRWNQRPYAAAAIRLPAPPLTLDDQVNQPLLLACFPLPVPPGIVTAAGYLQYAAHGYYAVTVTEPLDYPVFQLHLLPASDRKFRSSSTCIRSSASSLFRFCSSLSEPLRGRPFGCGA